MRLIRNTTPDGSCKYRLWNNALGRFEDDDKPGDLNEFFLIKLKDRNSEAALLAYAASVEVRDPEFAADVRELAARSGPHHAACKDPDSEPTPPSRPQGEAREALSSLLSFVGQMQPSEFIDALYALKSPGLELCERDDLIANLNEVIGQGWTALSDARPQGEEGLHAELHKLRAEVERLTTLAKNANADADMYANAWQRELGPYGFRNKRHHIDAMVLTTRELVADVVGARKSLEIIAQWKTDAAAARTIGVAEPDLLPALSNQGKPSS
jgi:hypothetical protein